MITAHLRPASPDDVATIHSLVRRAEVHDREPLVTPVEEIAELFDEPHLDPTRDLRLGFVGELPVAWGRVWHQPSRERQERAYLLGSVDPDWRRRGIGRQLFGWQVERARELLAAYDHTLPRYLRTAAWEWQTDAHQLYERFDFEPVRWFDELLRPLEPPLDRPAVPGVDIVAWQPDRTEEVRLLHNEVFADHWGSTAIDAESWTKRLSGYGTRLDLSVLALTADRVVGYSINETYPEDEGLVGRRDGWIGKLGVHRAFRGRGIAAALIAASLDKFRREGLTHASLGVDADNPTGAHRLYTRLGFRLETRSITHQLEL